MAKIDTCLYSKSSTRIGFFPAKKKSDWTKYNNKRFKFIDKNGAMAELID